MFLHEKCWRSYSAMRTSSQVHRQREAGWVSRSLESLAICIDRTNQTLPSRDFSARIDGLGQWIELADRREKWARCPARQGIVKLTIPR